ncbi:Vitamin B12 transporter BtuB (plasmid) [Sphingobium sp. AntQ-1]|nr:Vitamin B12 transporter BtuB [Sphingobium sp. AntQ-1]
MTTDNVATEKADVGLEDIIVTAQRRSENAQKVPIVVATVTAKTLQAAGVLDVTSLNVAIPGLQVRNAVGFSSPNLRGVGTNQVGAGFENPIATYVDGVYYGSASASLMSFNNIEQIEVLKGPQGTLFGRNATGGLIQVTTREPTATPTFMGSFSYGNYDTIHTDAYVGGGILPNVNADVAVQYGYQGKGWGTNLTTGRDVYKTDIDFAVRSKWVFTPGESTKLTVIADYSELRSSKSATGLIPGTYAFPGPGVVPPATFSNPWDVETDYQPGIATKAGGASLRIDQDMGDLNLVSVTAYRKSTFRCGQYLSV